MAGRLPVTDILHRGFLFALVGLSVGGLALGVQVHRETLRRGRGLMTEIDHQREIALQEGREVVDEKALAEAAYAALKSRYEADAKTHSSK